jgi:hypothetical protein
LPIITSKSHNSVQVSWRSNVTRSPSNDNPTSRRILRR